MTLVVEVGESEIGRHGVIAPPMTAAVNEGIFALFEYIRKNTHIYYKGVDIHKNTYDILANDMYRITGESKEFIKQKIIEMKDNYQIKSELITQQNEQFFSLVKKMVDIILLDILTVNEDLPVFFINQSVVCDMRRITDKEINSQLSLNIISCLITILESFRFNLNVSRYNMLNYNNLIDVFKSYILEEADHSNIYIEKSNITMRDINLGVIK